MIEDRNESRVLVLGATGHVGSQIVKVLASKGYQVRALVRRKGQIVQGLTASQETLVEYVLGDLLDYKTVELALVDIDIVVSTANAIIPGKNGDSVKQLALKGYENLISMSEKQGVKQFVQSSVPVHELEQKVPELWTKREIEKRLLNSSLNYSIVRNPAFMDVWLVMAGFKQAGNNDEHATTKRPYGFMQTYISLVGNLALKRGILLAPGGPDHGGAFISTEDVAQLMAGCVNQDEASHKIIECGGPQWLTWRQIALLISAKIGREVKPISFPAWLAAISRILTKPIMPSASNVLALTQFVATYQPHWESSEWIKRLGLPRQKTVEQYLDEQLKEQPLALASPGRS